MAQRVIVIVEDPDGSMDFQNGEPLASLDMLASFLVDAYNAGLISVIYTIGDIRAEAVLRRGTLEQFVRMFM